MPKSRPTIIFEPTYSFGEQNVPFRKRKACSTCRKLHSRCDGEVPCSRCVSAGRAHSCCLPAEPHHLDRIHSCSSSSFSAVSSSSSSSSVTSSALKGEVYDLSVSALHSDALIPHIFNDPDPSSLNALATTAANRMENTFIVANANASAAHPSLNLWNLVPKSMPADEIAVRAWKIEESTVDGTAKMNGADDDDAPSTSLKQDLMTDVDIQISSLSDVELPFVIDSPLNDCGHHAKEPEFVETSEKEGLPLADDRGVLPDFAQEKRDAVVSCLRMRAYSIMLSQFGPRTFYGDAFAEKMVSLSRREWKPVDDWNFNSLIGKFALHMDPDFRSTDVPCIAFRYTSLYNIMHLDSELPCPQEVLSVNCAFSTVFGWTFEEIRELGVQVMELLEKEDFLMVAETFTSKMPPILPSDPQWMVPQEIDVGEASLLSKERSFRKCKVTLRLYRSQARLPCLCIASCAPLA
eukprot:ANDGO_00151.mRNA.1 hypothetical protein